MIRRLYGSSVRGKVMVLVLAATISALLVAAAALVTYEVDAYRQTWVNDLTTQAEILARASAPALAFDDRKAAEGNLALLRSRSEIIDAAIYTSRGAIFAAYHREGGGASSLPALPDSNGYRIHGETAELFHRVIENNEILGTVYIRAEYALKARLLGYLAILAAVMLASLVVAALTSRVLQSAVTEPILAVAAAARRVIETRDFSMRVRRTTDDEVGTLVDAFNAMLAEVGGRAQALEESNRNLQRETAERRTAEAALRVADRRKDEFLATLAHELRNPLAPLANALAILGNRKSPPEVREEAREVMARQLRQTVRLVDDLLDVSRITTGKLVLHREQVELGPVLHDAVETVRPLIDARGQELSVRTPERAVHVQADPTRLAQVFSNLLSNASKYTPPGGHVRLDARVEGDDVVVQVTDDGIGIAPDMLPQVFDMFVQADTSLERTQSGLGVGLTLARRLVELHGGTLEAHSDGVGRGSRFTTRLPALPLPARSTGGDAQVAPPQDLPCYRILLADDNLDFVASMAALLRVLGHEVEVAHDGPEAVAAAERFRPQFAFLDIGLPGMNGYDVARRIRQSAIGSDVVLVAVTGWGQDKDRELAREAGFDQHLVKPVEFSTIESLLAALRPRGATARPPESGRV